MKNLLISLVIILGISTSVLAFLQFGSWSLIEVAPDQPVEVHSIVLDKIEELGKMELLKYHYEDMVEYEVIKEYWPDPKVVLFVKGETVGCIDFSQVDSTDIQMIGDSIMEVSLPDPEICYSKLDHSQSRVYDLEYTWFNDFEQPIQEAYAAAEKEILNSAIHSGILEQTREQAEIMLVPLLTSLSGKQVRLHFPPQNLEISPIRE